ALISRVATTCFHRKLERCHAPRRWIAQHPDGIAKPFHDMERHMLLAEPIVILSAAEMQLSDRINTMTRFTQPVRPRRNGPVIRDAIVPKPDVVDIAAGLKARTRGHADRGVAIGIGETHPAGRE